MNYSSLDPELGDTNISLNDDSIKDNKIETKKTLQQMKEKKESNQENSNNESSSFFMNIFQSKRKELVSSLITKAQDKGKSWYEKLICDFTFLQPYFEISIPDIKQRLKNGFIPFNKKFVDIKPDFYGPFWIYTTLIFFISACGSIPSINNKASTSNFASFIPKAAALVSKYY